MSNPYARELPRQDVPPELANQPQAPSLPRTPLERDYPDAKIPPPALFDRALWARHRGDDFDAWLNPTGDRLDFKVFDRPGVFFRVVIEPGATVELPREWRGAIHTTNEHGVVIGGYAPQLVRVGAEGVHKHPALSQKERLPERPRQVLDSQAAEQVLRRGAG